MGDKGRAGIHKHTHEDRNQREREHIDTENAVAHHERNQYWEDEHHGIEHQDAARFEEIVIAEKCQINREQRHENGYKEYLSDECIRDFSLCCITSLHLTLKGTQHTISIIIDDFATVNHLLTAHHHATGKRDTS